MNYNDRNLAHAQHKYVKKIPKPGGGFIYYYPEDLKAKANQMVGQAKSAMNTAKQKGKQAVNVAKEKSGYNSRAQYVRAQNNLRAQTMNNSLSPANANTRKAAGQLVNATKKKYDATALGKAENAAKKATAATKSAANKTGAAAKKAAGVAGIVAKEYGLDKKGLKKKLKKAPEKIARTADGVNARLAIGLNKAVLTGDKQKAYERGLKNYGGLGDPVKKYQRERALTRKLKRMEEVSAKSVEKVKKNLSPKNITKTINKNKKKRKREKTMNKIKKYLSE